MSDCMYKNPSIIQELDFALDCSPVFAVTQVYSSPKAATARAITEQLLASEAAYLHKAGLSVAAQLSQLLPKLI